VAGAADSPGVPGGAGPGDPVCPPRLALADPRIRRASPLVTLPLTLLAAAALGLAGRRILQLAGPPRSQAPATVAVDLLDLGEGRPAAPAPARPAPSAPMAPPPGAIVRPDAPPPPVPAEPESAPERPPAQLPSQDLSGVAFPPAPAAQGQGGAGAGSVPGGGGEGAGAGVPGSGRAPRVVELDSSEVEVLFRPPVTPATYPALARARRIQGAVAVELTVGVDGVPIASRALAGPNLLRPAAESLAGKYRFRPETRNGAPVIARFTLNIVFQLS